MFHIYIKGILIDESQLIQGKTLPESTVPFREGKNINAAFQLGFLLSLPIMLPMVALSIFRCSGLEKQLHFNHHMVVAVLVFFVMFKALTYLHEFIHALFYPSKAEKTIWKDAKQGAYFIYCDVPVSKRRFIILNIAPSIILGIFPTIFSLKTVQKVIVQPRTLHYAELLLQKLLDRTIRFSFLHGTYYFFIFTQFFS